MTGIRDRYTAGIKTIIRSPNCLLSAFSFRSSLRWRVALIQPPVFLRQPPFFLRLPSKLLMEKGKPAEDTLAASLKKLDLDSVASNSTSSPSISSLKPSRFRREKKGKPPSLVSLCLGLLGAHLEDIVGQLGEISIGFPAHIKLAVAAIARRRRLLNNDVIVSLADSSWEVVDISGSDVTDSGLAAISQICSQLRAIDIRGITNRKGTMFSAAAAIILLLLASLNLFNIASHCKR